MPDAANNPARILAPLALVLFAIAFFVVILTSGAGEDEGPDRSAATQRSSSRQPAKSKVKRSAPQRSSYTVKTGDTLGGIAEKTGVPVERLQEFNPELDPQALVSGQKIKLRE
jgi:LysM repeat protein